MASKVLERGMLVATALAGAWRSSPPSLSLSRWALAEVTPLLLATGAGGLGWWRVRSCGLSRVRAASRLQQAYRLHTLQVAVHEEQIKEAVTLLRSAGIEPILGKGWAVGRLYPEPGLRPYGDIDLCIRAEEHAAAAAALAASGAGPVDLHRAFAGLQDRSFDELLARSRLVTLGGVAVRVLGPEDHLRLLCVHMLGHGAWRPLWLCDIGLALESRPADFDWDYCLGEDARRSDWVACAFGLAQRLLEARLEDTPFGGKSARLPRWLVPVVLRQWGAGYVQHDPIVDHLRRPVEALKILRHCWPNPILATVQRGGPFNNLPRLPFQLAQCVSRTAEIVAQLAGARPGAR